MSKPVKPYTIYYRITANNLKGESTAVVSKLPQNDKKTKWITIKWPTKKGSK